MTRLEIKLQKLAERRLKRNNPIKRKTDMLKKIEIIKREIRNFYKND